MAPGSANVRGADLKKLGTYLSQSKPTEIDRVHLEMRQAGFDDVTEGALADFVGALGALPNLKSLGVWHGRIGANALQALAAASPPALERLDLLDVKFKGDAAFAALEPLLGTLTDLSVQIPNATPSTKQLESLLRAVAKGSLRSFNASYFKGPLKGKQAGRMWGKACEGALEHLVLGGVELEGEGTAELVTAVSSSDTLKRLSLKDCWPGADGLDALASPKLRIEELDIEDEELETTDVYEALVRLLGGLKNLQRLTIQNGNLSAAAKQLAAGLSENRQLRILELPQTSFQGEDAVLIARAVGRHPRLEELGVSLGTKDPKQHKDIVSTLAPRLTSLRESQGAWLVLGLLAEGKLDALDVSRVSQLGAELAALYQLAARSPTLRRLSVSRQKHSTDAKKALLELIATQRGLRHLDLRFCGLGPSDVSKVLSAVEKHPALETLGIWDNDLPTSVKQHVAGLWSTHPTLTRID